MIRMSLYLYLLKVVYTQSIAHTSKTGITYKFGMLMWTPSMFSA